MIKSTAINTAYAGVELEGNNTNGTVKIKTLKAYHAGLHIWNNSSDIKFDAYSEDITAGGGLIIGRDVKIAMEIHTLQILCMSLPLLVIVKQGT